MLKCVNDTACNEMGSVASHLLHAGSLFWHYQKRRQAACTGHEDQSVAVEWWMDGMMVAAMDLSQNSW